MYHEPIGCVNRCSPADRCDPAREGKEATMLTAILIPLGLAILMFTVILARAAIAKRAVPLPEAVALGAIVSFFDTLGIGSFAPTTAWLKFRKLVPDRI